MVDISVWGWTAPLHSQTFSYGWLKLTDWHKFSHGWTKRWHELNKNKFLRLPKLFPPWKTLTTHNSRFTVIVFRRQSHQSFHSSSAPSPSLRVTIASVSSPFSPAVINSGPHRVALLALSSPHSSPFPSACLKPLHLCQPALYLAGHRHTRGRRLTRFPLFSRTPNILASLIRSADCPLFHIKCPCLHLSVGVVERFDSIWSVWTHPSRRSLHSDVWRQLLCGTLPHQCAF